MAIKTKTAKVPAKKAEPKKSGLFISRRMRRDAELRAKDEAEAAKQAQEDAEDAAEQAKMEADPVWQAKSAAEKTFLTEQAIAQANAEARKKYGLK